MINLPQVMANHKKLLLADFHANGTAGLVVEERRPRRGILNIHNPVSKVPYSVPLSCFPSS